MSGQRYKLYHLKQGKITFEVMKMGMSRRQWFKHIGWAWIGYGAFAYQPGKAADALNAGSGPVGHPVQNAARPTRPRVSVKDFGAKGDGVADDYAAIQRAVGAISKAGGGTLVFPKGIYLVDHYKIRGKEERNPISDFTFRGIDGLAIEGNASKIVMQGGWTRTADYSNGKYQYSYASQVGFLFIGCKNLSVRNLEIDGGAATIQKGEERLAEGTSHGLYLSGCQNVELTNLHIHHYCVDGLYITRQSTTISTHVSGTNCRFTNNGRQGMSIIQLRYAAFTNCDFNETGLTGMYGGHSPMAGVDIEPNVSVPKVDDYTGDIKFTNCRFVNNQGFQYVGTSYATTPYTVTFLSCVFKETRDKPRHRTCDVLPATKLTRFEACRFENTPLFPSYAVKKNNATVTEVIRCTFVSDRADQQMLSCLAPEAVNLVDGCEFIFNAPAPASKPAYRRIFIDNTHTRFVNNKIFISRSEHPGNGADLVALIYNAQEAARNRWDTDLASPGQYFTNAYAGVQPVADTFPHPEHFRPGKQLSSK